MKIVEFTRDMRPHVAGESRLVPDEVAERLVSEGVVRNPPRDFPESEAKPARQTLTLSGKHGRRRDQTYQTR